MGWASWVHAVGSDSCGGLVGAYAVGAYAVGAYAVGACSGPDGISCVRVASAGSLALSVQVYVAQADAAQTCLFPSQLSS